ncbi:MAG TPA: hypothetical protein VGS57_18290 [Thermoanaerobaculia bacterium]|jgi:hypothetical protein|nr:hypothetical protein [Thermoanaerobaculia bacterium]
MWKHVVTLGLASWIAGAAGAHAQAVVSNGRFTNVYVFPDPDKETWEQHMAGLRPKDAASFSRATIDKYTAALMSGWPGYFDPLMQWGIHPPHFFGSAVASKACVVAALRDRVNGVLQVNTVRSLSNCHIDGKDPSPQVNLIFSPDIKLAEASLGNAIGTSSGGDMCTTTSTNAYHSGGLNTPNFTVLPTSTTCTPSFESFTRTLSHEVVETLTDPALAGVGSLGRDEVGDTCERNGKNNPNHLDSVAFTTYKGYSVERYWSNDDQRCEPRFDPPAGSVAVMWVLGERSPLKRFTGDVHNLSLLVPLSRRNTDAEATQAKVFIQTGGDDLRGGSNAADNADVALEFRGGSKVTTNVNGGDNWNNGTTHSAVLELPSHLKVSDITGVTVKSHFTGGISGDNWNVDKVALQVSFPAGSKVDEPETIIVHDWLDASGAPLKRFTGDVHELAAAVGAQDVGKPVRALDLIIFTGNDDLRGGSNPNDNCNVEIDLVNHPERPIKLFDVNHGKSFEGWSMHTISIPLPADGLRGGDVKAVKVSTHFGGGIGGDNWNVEAIRLRATLGVPPPPTGGAAHPPGPCQQACQRAETRCMQAAHDAGQRQQCKTAQAECRAECKPGG